MVNDYREKHTFVICAYKESPYLEECICSLKRQKTVSSLLMTTSTPNVYIRKLAKKHKIPLRINEGEAGIVQDWNFVYSQCTTPYITIAHQDDVYFPDYSEHAVNALDKAKKPLIYFTNYCEVRGNEKVCKNKILRVKRTLLFALRNKYMQQSRFVRRRLLSLGAVICCPAVTFARGNLPDPVFTVRYRSCEDWEAWERLSRLKGAFVYDSSIQMGHRIHEQSETSVILSENGRVQEDFEMFCKFWPKPIACILTKIYSCSEKSNHLN